MSLFILLLIALNEETNETLIDSINYCNMKEICETTYTIKKSPPFQTLLKKKKKKREKNVEHITACLQTSRENLQQMLSDKERCKGEEERIIRKSAKFLWCSTFA